MNRAPRRSSLCADPIRREQPKWPPRRNCSIFSSWRDQMQARFSGRLCTPRGADCSEIRLITDSRQAPKGTPSQNAAPQGLSSRPTQSI